MKLRNFFTVAFVAIARARKHCGRAVLPSIDHSCVNHLSRKLRLARAILPAFTKETGITVHVLAQGTGQALQTAARDDADLVLVHDPEAEQKFIAAGDGIDRRQIAWNDFIVVGPRSTRRISPAAAMRLRR